MMFFVLIRCSKTDRPDLSRGRRLAVPDGPHRPIGNQHHTNAPRCTCQWFPGLFYNGEPFVHVQEGSTGSVNLTTAISVCTSLYRNLPPEVFGGSIEADGSSSPLKQFLKVAQKIGKFASFGRN